MDFLISSLDLFCTGQFAKKNCSESFFRSFIVTFLVAVNHGMHSSQLSPSDSAPPLFSAMVQTVQYPEWLHHRLASRCSALNCKPLQRVVKTSQHITSMELPSMEDLYTQWCRKYTNQIITVYSYQESPL